ncbi:MAG: 2-oxo-4-hydroxy-4-carboxy-5-ureidoimidazoline decarboxylase [Gaiellales bacterium]
MHELPRQLSAFELSELFEGDTRFVQLLAERDDPLAEARKILSELPEELQVEALNAHPRIGQHVNISERSEEEQGSDWDPVLLRALARLNKTYEEKFGFRFVVFVNERPRAEILPVLRGRLQNPRKQELETALDELVAIAYDRWRSR